MLPALARAVVGRGTETSVIPARRASRAEAASMTLEQLMDCLPAATLALNETRQPCVISPEAHRQFKDCVGSIIRHPAFQNRLDHVLADLSDSPAPGEAVVVLDIPQYRVVRAWMRKATVPSALVPEGYRKPGFSPTTPTTLIFVALHDETEAVVAERQHTDFVAFASHELRTPLAALLGFIETLQGPAADDPAAQKEFLDIMAVQARRMQRLLDSLLYLSRVQMQEHLRPTDVVAVGALFDHVRAEAAGLMAGKNVRLEVTPGAEPGLSVAGDEVQLQQVLMNLIENALKYGLADRGRRQGQPLCITLSCEPPPPDGCWPGEPGVLLNVTDTGPGIPARHLSRLTERFYRVARTAASVQGSGLGLAIVQHVVTRHGGRFVVESAVGKGTTCRIWLPVVRGLS
ncbi:two-component sensor histidine kinase [Acetobacter sp. TBRC 12305]|uniref:histidine kinase n=2 Tax=Acetobacter garciniae TaxID=2817435 RepID=A0A939KQ71_9PROT|nr:ATP-binding protein [Acetobacter garciniae]MBO1324969.1 two-component sensor histidine kinase [Acetobacter garciniae]MBX0344660.1 two-component sensor histidine kinase [Acetobacter garciniae]